MSLGPYRSGMSRDRSRTRDRSGGPATDRDRGTDFDVGIDESGGGSAHRDAESRGLRERAAARARRLFAPRRFLLALALSVGGALAGTFVPLPAAGLAGVLLATFVFGLVVPERRYAEAAVAGGLVVGTSFLFDYLVFAFLGGLGVAPALLGAGLGAVVALAGTYFGRDLRHGLTRDVA